MMCLLHHVDVMVSIVIIIKSDKTVLQCMLHAACTVRYLNDRYVSLCPKPNNCESEFSKFFPKCHGHSVMK